MRSFLVALCCFATLLAFPKSTNAFLNHADSLVHEGKFGDAFNFLLPLECEFENETDINKYHYYGLISGWYLRNNDYSSAILYLEKQARYNLTKLDDFLYLANLFSTRNEILNRSKAEYYARKALLMNDEYTRFAYEKDYSDKDIGRLHYILGVLAARSGNKVISKDHLKWINNNISTLDSELISHLEAVLDEIQDQKIILNSDSIRLHSLGLIKESFFNKGERLSSSKKIYQEDKEYFFNEIDSVMSISNMAQLLRNVFYIEDKYGLDNIDKSVSILRQACEISNQNEFYKTSSLELCELYMRLGRADFFLKQYDSSITWFLLAYSTSRKLSNSQSYNIQALGEIAEIYLERGEKYISILYADEMLESIAKAAICGNIDTEILTYLSKYANILSNTGFDDQAEDFYKFVITIAPKQSNAYSLACNNYATQLFLHNKREEACYYYELIKDAYPSPQTIANLAIANLVSGKIIEAEKTFHEYYEQNLSLLENILQSFTEREWDDYWDKNGYEFNITSNYLAANINTPKSLIRGYNACILSKLLPLAYKNIFKQSVISSQDSTIRHYYSKYTSIKQELSSSAYAISEKAQLINELSELERLLIQNTDFDSRLRSLIKDYSSVVNSLKPDEIAIEFCQYLDILNSTATYAAYLISPEYEWPVFIVIGDEIELSNAIFNAHKDVLSINDSYTQSNIGNLIWGSILPYLKNKHRIYYSPVGELSLLNHELLRIDDNRLGELFDMRRISSTNSIDENLSNDGSNYNSIVLYGDINYNSICNSEAMAINHDKSNSERQSHPFLNDDIRDGWAHLQHTKQELDSIQSVIRNYNIYSTQYLGANATEETFKTLNFNAPSIIHIATHGFTYYSNEDEEKRNKITSVSPHTSESVLMSWTGLLFAGANNTLIYQSSNTNFDDGILTANEISQLHLDGTNLAVLSACNTGLGINDTFGQTIGLQKAFKMAGVKSILMSLWQVPDESTAVLMTKFYDALFHGHNRHEALRIAMNKIREIYPDPYYWGAFVILD